MVGRKGLQQRFLALRQTTSMQGEIVVMIEISRSQSNGSSDIRNINFILVNRLRYFHKRACQEVHANGRRHHAVAVRQQ